MINLANKKNRLLKYIFLISVFCVSLALTENKKEEGKSFLNVLDLKCEYTGDPIGLDIQTPQISIYGRKIILMQMMEMKIG